MVSATIDGHSPMPSSGIMIARIARLGIVRSALIVLITAKARPAVDDQDRQRQPNSQRKGQRNARHDQMLAER